MTKEQESLQGHVSDMKAATEHILEAVKRQNADSRVSQSTPTHALLQRIETSLQMQIQQLTTQLERYGPSSPNPMKEAFAQITGAMAGLYDKVRPQTISRMLRDDYTALSLATVSNTMLHTTALVLNDPQCAHVALLNTQQLAGFIVELGQAVLPEVESDLAREGLNVQEGASHMALGNVRRAWSSDQVKA